MNDLLPLPVLPFSPSSPSFKSPKTGSGVISVALPHSDVVQGWEDDRLPLLSWLPSQVKGIHELGPGCQAASPMPVWRLLSWPCPRQLSVSSAPSLESLSAGDNCGSLCAGPLYRSGDHIVTLPPFRALHGPNGLSPVLFWGVEVHCEVGCTSAMGYRVWGPTACP